MWTLYKKYDLWSIYEGLEKVMDYYIDGNEKGSLYWDHYSDQINEMGVIAGEMYEEMQEIRYRLDYKYNLPCKKIEFCDEDDARDHTAISWWNTAACMLHDTDMVALIDNEDPNFYGDYEQEKEKRIKSLERLTKRQQMILYTEVVGFIARYTDLMAAFETITAVIRELEYHQSFVKTKESIVAPKEAYL
ncbi:hypothetical protein [Schaedlerella arabinosiphila]|uniref:hypothetical protein n=1 Tax=Schaedlerella arabinosiphila TaxID=2044587 RepID=UPI002557E53F|nr:hypothetical protein [Schaedlerella arabinosiphila]